MAISRSPIGFRSREETVKSRVKNILFKLGAHDRTAMIGLKRGIIKM